MAEQDKFEAMEVHTRKQLEEQQKLAKKKKRNYIVGFSLLGASVLGLVAVYVLATQVWLVDLSMLPFIKYSYSIHNDEKTATLVSVDADDPKLPSHFVVPKKVNGLTVTAIAPNAFIGNEKITSVSMPDTITSIGDYAFAACSNLEHVKLSKNITSLGRDVFKGAPFFDNLPQDDISTISQILFKVGDSILSEKSILLANEDSLKNVPDEFKNYKPFYLDEYKGSPIGGWSEGLFANKDQIYYAEIPSYLEALPANSFQGCDNLKAVKFMGGTTAIKENAFQGAKNLETVIIPDDVTEIGKSAFEGTAITNITLSDKVETLGPAVFKNSKLESFTWPDQLKTIPDEIFMNCENLTEFKMSDVAYQEITSLGTSSFENTALESFNFPINLGSVPNRVFAKAKNLKSVTMFESYFYKNKEGIVYPKGITTLGYESFMGTKLEEIRLVDESGNFIPSSPKGSVTLPLTCARATTSSSYGSNFAGVDGALGAPITNFHFPYYFLETSKGMFKNCDSLTDDGLTFDTYHAAGRVAGLKTIASETFMGADGFVNFPALPESIDTINAAAFADMANLQSITLPNSPAYTVIESNLFEDDVKLKSVNIPSQVYSYKAFSFANNFDLPYLEITSGKGETLAEGEKAPLDIEHKTFYNLRKGVRDPESYEFLDDENKKPLPIKERMPILLHYSADQLDPMKVLEPEYKGAHVPQNILDNKFGWFDIYTCVPFFKGEWEINEAGELIISEEVWAQKGEAYYG